MSWRSGASAEAVIRAEIRESVPWTASASSRASARSSSAIWVEATWPRNSAADRASELGRCGPE